MPYMIHAEESDMHVAICKLCLVLPLSFPGSNFNLRLVHSFVSLNSIILMQVIANNTKWERNR